MNKSKVISSFVLLSVALLLTILIFIVDLNVSQDLAVGAMYTIVILYSWLLPGKSSSLIAAGICTGLIILGLILSNDFNTDSDTYILNSLISIIALWICAFLVAIAESSFRNLEESKIGLEEKIELRTKELNKYNNQLISKNKELEQFAFIASHDLREPLLTILNFTELLERDYFEKLSVRGLKYLGFISSSSARMRDVIMGLLDYSQIGMNSKKRNIDCNVLVNEVLQDLDLSITQSNAKLLIHPLPTIDAYHVELRLLFQNLISNAIKFQHKGNQPVIEIDCKVKTNAWRFSVKDNGIGIPQTFKEKIFIIFQQLNARDKYEGSGIGLAHCHKVVDLHGGLIWVKSEEGKGSNFSFTIPRP